MSGKQFKIVSAGTWTKQNGVYPQKCYSWIKIKQAIHTYSAMNGTLKHFAEEKSKYKIIYIYT